MATTSKAFRARAFDSNRSMTVYWANELPDLSECSAGNRAVTQMPSGMEKEEEMESHLQDAIIAQQASTSGIAIDKNVIPTPKVEIVDENRYNTTYKNRNKMHRSKYIKVHAWQALEKDDPDYDYDTEDEAWLAEHTHVEPKVLEQIFDTVECHSSETQIASEDSVINIHKSLDSSIVYEVYEYWLSKRTSAATTSGCVGVGGLIPRVRTECRKDGQGAVNPYVAFRRRAEKMQTRKNRKNDEDSYEKILKLVHDMAKAQQLFDMTARREKQKLALIDVEQDILVKRMEMSDFGTTSAFNEFAEKMRVSTEVAKPMQPVNGNTTEKKKKVRRKIADKDLVSKAWLKKNAECWNRPPSLFGQIGPPGVPAAKPSRESMADGRFAFKRRRGCVYRAALPVYPIHVPAAPSAAPVASQSSVAVAVASASSTVVPPARADPPASKHMRYFNTFMPDSNGALRSIGFARRRMGRGGRVLLDRMPRQPTGEGKVSTDPWAEYCIADSSKTYRAQQSLETEDESEVTDSKSLYFARSNRVNFNDDELEREWAAQEQASWRDSEDEPTEQIEDLEKAPQEESTSNENDDSEVERMDVDGQEDDAQITDSKQRAINGNGNEKHDKNEDEVDMDVDEPSVVERIRHMNGGKMKPLKDLSPPISGNGRADRAEPTPVPAKSLQMCGTVSDSDEWREPSGSPSESNSSTEWSGYTQEQVVASIKAKMMNVDDEEPSPARAHGHSIKDSMSTVTMLERKKFLLPSPIGM